MKWRFIYARIHARPSQRRRKLRARSTFIRRSSINKRSAAALACMDSDGSEGSGPVTIGRTLKMYTARRRFEGQKGG